MSGHVRPVIGGLRVDRTRTERVEKVFQKMADNGYATSTIDHAWSYLNQACQHALRRRKVKTNPVADARCCRRRVHRGNGSRSPSSRSRRRSALGCVDTVGCRRFGGVELLEEAWRHGSRGVRRYESAVPGRISHPQVERR